jgi:hypothetical protein
MKSIFKNTKHNNITMEIYFKPNTQTDTKTFPDKQVNCKLIGEDGNAFYILGRFKGAAKKDGWTDNEINIVIDEATSSDYNHLLCVIDTFCVDPVESESLDEYSDEDESGDG